MLMPAGVLPLAETIVALHAVAVVTPKPLVTLQLPIKPLMSFVKLVMFVACCCAVVNLVVKSLIWLFCVLIVLWSVVCCFVNCAILSCKLLNWLAFTPVVSLVSPISALSCATFALAVVNLLFVASLDFQNKNVETASPITKSTKIIVGQVMTIRFGAYGSRGCLRASMAAWSD